MGNCQAIDNASLVIQQPSGRVDKMYWPVPASHIMKLNPGYYVALLLTTTLYPPPPSSTASAAAASSNNESLRVTRIKLLRPTDNLVLGQTYRLVSSQEVMKGLWAKKYAKMQKKQTEASAGELNTSSDFDIAATRSSLDKKTRQVIKHDRHRTKTTTTSSSPSTKTNSATAKPRGWHPSLNSISEATS